jgi:hypothetical protein
MPNDQSVKNEGAIKKPVTLTNNRQNVGMTGFEPAASSSRTKRATGLRYIPKIEQQI